MYDALYIYCYGDHRVEYDRDFTKSNYERENKDASDAVAKGVNFPGEIF